MVKFFKEGRVVVMLSGRYAGKKAVILKAVEDKTRKHQHPHILVAGINKAPKRVATRMGQRRITKKSGLKPFVKVVNFSHVLPTRYSCEIPSRKTITIEKVNDPVARRGIRKNLKKVFVEKYQNGENKWLFQKLHF
ncbi:putative 60S ribosomal protein L27 [Blattamonas nauphoetae]|uniref:60S ribosomal protein L27 n=1 Tax=Blattamonas nauphoetae TaxID=2049346 RepID=A0ABQ9YLA5_9EUKA|nr:putative 60S ribosomal protein L27 [Blattamonas nauphoetae]